MASIGEKVIVVFGATGAQGNGLVRAICADKDGGYRARVVTRTPDSAKAQALAALGAEVVQADAYNPADVERVLVGAYGAFFVTWSFEPSPDPEKEIAQVQSYAEASKAVGLKHAIFSTTEDTSKFVPLDSKSIPTIDGKWKIPHFEAKGGSERFFDQACVPTTFLRASFYYDNLLTLFPPTMGEDGKYAFTIPLADKQIAWVAADDIGKCAYGIFKGGPSKYGGHQPACGEHMSLTELAATFEEAFAGQGHKFAANTFVSPAIFRTFGFAGCEALGNMFQFEQEFSDMYCFNRSIEKSREYNPALLGFSEWLAQNKDKVPFVGGSGELNAGEGTEEAPTPAEELDKLTLDDIGFSLTLDPAAARLRSSMIQKSVDVWKRAFKISDKNGDGVMTLAGAMAAGIAEADFNLVDVSGTGTVSVEEFIHLSQSVAPELQLVRAMFFIEAADTTGNHMMSLDEAKAVGINEAAFKKIDKAGTGNVTKEVFAQNNRRPSVMRAMAQK